MDSNLQPRSTKRGRLWWVGRILLGLAVFLLIAISATLVAGAQAKSNLKAKYPPPGAMVDVGGYHLHIFCQGTGSPTVVMEAGLGSSSLLWELVRPEVAKSTRTCVYDRAGLGWSDLSPQPRTSENIVAELHTLLTNAGVAGPYLLVGHSIGGAFVRLYAHRYPNDVVGMVLVDSSHEDQMAHYPPAFARLAQESSQQAVQQLETFRPLGTTGVMALSPSLVPAPSQLPQATREAYQALFAGQIETIIAEQIASEPNFAQIRAARITSLGNIPLVVLVHGHVDPIPPSANVSPEVIQQEEVIWRQLQTELAGLSKQGKLVIAEKSGHFILLEQPQLVIDAIREVLADTRK